MKKVIVILLFGISQFAISQTATEQVNDNKSQVEEPIYKSEELTTKADFPGGISKFYKFVMSNFKMPEDPNLNGKIIISFVIEKNGDITNIEVDDKVGFGCDGEAIRLMKASPRWIPGELDGQKVRSYFKLPITIKTE